jgi:hypothetical protein
MSGVIPPLPQYAFINYIRTLVAVASLCIPCVFFFVKYYTDICSRNANQPTNQKANQGRSPAQLEFVFGPVVCMSNSCYQ